MFCIPFKQRKKKCQRDVGDGYERSSCQLKSLQTDAPHLSPTTIPAISEALKKIKKTSWWHLWPVYKKKKNKTGLKQDVVEFAVPSPSVTEKSTSTESCDGEASVLVRASHSPDNAVSAPDELQMQSDHRDETPDSVQPFLSTEEAVKFTEELEDIEYGDLCSSPPSYTEEVHQTDQDSREEKRILPSDTEQIIDNQMTTKEAEADVPNNIRLAPQSPDAAVSENTTLLPSVEKERAVDNTSAQFGVRVETLPDGDTPSSVAPEKGSHNEKENWVEKLFLASPAAKQSLKKTNAVPASEIGCKGDSPICPSPASREKENDKKIKMTLWFFLVQLFYDKRVFPVQEEEVKHTSGSATDVSVSLLNEIQQNSSTRSDLFITGSNGHKSLKLKSGTLSEMDTKMPGQTSTLDHITSPQATFNSPGLSAKVYKLFAKPFLRNKRNKETIPNKELVCLGLPNLGLTCYINSTLQSLLTLSCFVQEIHNQMLVWSSHPKSKLFRGFLDIGLCRFYNTREEKKMILSGFKRAVAEFNSDFDDSGQKDAHEFLVCVLNTVRSLTPEMQHIAANLGLTYTCPVSEHIALQMLNTRTCRGCGEQSHTVEDFLNLSLDLVRGGSVNQCLQEYLKEGQLEYMCHCGVQDSTLQTSFFTLPNLLILHLKRFTFTRSYTVKKIKKPIALSRELVVKEEFMATKDTTAHYSLVSVVSHIGSKADSGHYICDSVHRRQDMGDTVDSWLTYDDERVSQTTGEAVCLWREKNAFLLFYEKQSWKN